MSCCAYPNLSQDLDHYRLDFSRCISDINSINISDADILLVIFSPSSRSRRNFLFACLLVRKIMAAPSTLLDWRVIGTQPVSAKVCIQTGWISEMIGAWEKIKSTRGMCGSKIFLLEKVVITWGIHDSLLRGLG